MTNIIGVTRITDKVKVMVNADQILWLEPGLSSDYDARSTNIVLVGGEFLHVREDIYDLVERIEPEPDYDDIDAN